jgi:predicted NBD/HSP70 family sugar kinase
MAGEGTKVIDLNLIEKAVAQQDMDVIDIFDDTMRKWAIAVINLSVTLDPDLIILGGSVNEKNNIVLSRIRHYISKILSHDANIILGETTEYQMYGGMRILRAFVFNTMLAERLFAES